MRSRVFLRHSVLFATITLCLLGCATHETHHHHKSSAAAPPPPPPPTPPPPPPPAPAPEPGPTTSYAPAPALSPAPVPMPASILGPAGSSRVGGAARHPMHREPLFPTATTAASSRPAPRPSAYPLGDAINAWQNQLKSGNIDYSVPSPMIAKQATRVSVTIHGFADTNTQPAAGVSAPTGHDTLKISDQMEVKLSYDPTEFTVDAQGDPPIKIVPEAGRADWIWYVTPINKESSQITLQVYLLYPGANGNIESPIEEKTYPVTVNVQKLTTTIDRSFWNNPMAFIEYMSPGGKGAAALVALCSFLGLGTWLKKKFGPKSSTPS